jgi:acetylornithine deacetylase
VNAVHAAMRVVDALRALDESWAGGVDPVERSAVLVSGVRSEGETFTVPATCRLTVEVRTTAASPSAQVGEVMRVLAGAAGDADVSSTISLARPPVALATDHPFVLTVCAAVGIAEHREAVVGAAPYWTDAALHMAAGTPTVVFGPCGEGLHEALEWVGTDSLRRVTAALTGVARAWCSDDR